MWNIFRQNDKPNIISDASVSMYADRVFVAKESAKSVEKILVWITVKE